VQSHYHAVRRMCRERGVLFEDREFPPGPRVLFHHKKPPVHPIVWMRPGVSIQRVLTPPKQQRKDAVYEMIYGNWYAVMGSITVARKKIRIFQY
jgi:hypothetical protein